MLQINTIDNLVKRGTINIVSADKKKEGSKIADAKEKPELKGIR